MSGNVIEAEKAPEKDEGPCSAAVSDVPDVERAVEGASVDVGGLEGGVGNETFAGESGVDQAADQAVSGHPMALVKLGVLPACKDAGMEADEGEPSGVGRRETEFEEGLLTASQMGDLEGFLHGRKWMARCVRSDVTRRLIALTERRRVGTPGRIPPRGPPPTESAAWIGTSSPV